MPARLFIGVMSGTSCDGVDAALVDVHERGPAMRATFRHLTSLPYSPADRDRIDRVRRGVADIAEVAAVGHATADRYVDCVRQLLLETGIRPADVTAVAAHGQTLFHAPPITYQAFDPARLATLGIDVVSDFRRADCAAGGQGAPLVPFGDWVMFRAAVPRVLLNLGGIANVTVLPGDAGVGAANTAGLAAVGGYDVGPANCLSDWLLRDHGGVDHGGERAARGRVLDEVVRVVLADAFFARPGPKSTDTPAMIALFAAALQAVPAASLDDRLATANAIAATAIVDQIGRIRRGESGGVARTGATVSADLAPEVFVAGGGVLNRHLMGLIEAGLRADAAGETASDPAPLPAGPLQWPCSAPADPPATPGPLKWPRLRTTDALGVPAQAREAAAFAVLAAAHVDRFACWMPRVTGATRPAVLGSLTPGVAADYLENG